MTRTLSAIAIEIAGDWAPRGKGIYFGAVPYIQALAQLETVDDVYGMDDARGIVRYFLCNATTWRGDVARRVKLELKTMVGDA
jgi:hypothetical protein